MVKITDVEKGSCADKNGIKPEDVLISVNGNEIEDVSKLTDHDIIVNWDPTNKD